MSSRCSQGRRPALVAVAVIVATVTFRLPVAATDAPISAAVAGLYVGREQIVEGKVESAERRESTVRLHLGPAPQSLAVSLVIGLLSQFPPQPEQYYLGKDIRVTGTIESFRGVPEISIRDPDRIQIVDPIGGVQTSAAARGRAANAEEAAQLRQQVEQLRSQMQKLEGRLKQLEGDAPQP